MTLLYRANAQTPTTLATLLPATLHSRRLTTFGWLRSIGRPYSSIARFEPTRDALKT